MNCISLKDAKLIMSTIGLPLWNTGMTFHYILQSDVTAARSLWSHRFLSNFKLDKTDVTKFVKQKLGPKQLRCETLYFGMGIMQAILLCRQF